MFCKKLLLTRSAGSLAHLKEVMGSGSGRSVTQYSEHVGQQLINS